MKALVIGGGIGGLTTAIALQQNGIEVQVFESAEQPRADGAGLALAPNAMKIYSKLGLDELVIDAGHSFKRGAAIMTCDGTVLGEMDADQTYQTHGFYLTAIHRPRLHKILLDQCKHVEGSKTFVRYEVSGDQIIAHFADGTSTAGDLLIGCDGIKSKVRQQAVGDVAYRYSGQTCWRLMTEFDDQTHYDMVEMWGNQGGLRVGSGTVGAHMVYTFITAKAPQDQRDNADTIKRNLSDLCAEFPERIHQLITETPIDQILRNDIYDFKPISKWFNNRVVLVGDAAHATTPNLGQGACQAIESAYALSCCLAEFTDLREAFQKYQDRRIKKARHVIRTSWRMGQMVNLNNPVARWARNQLMRLSSRAQLQKMQDHLYSINH